MTSSSVERLTSEPDYDAEMRLPSGATCDDCRHAARCFGLGFITTGRASCDFWPSRFAGRAALKADGEG